MLLGSYILLLAYTRVTAGLLLLIFAVNDMEMMVPAGGIEPTA